MIRPFRSEVSRYGEYSKAGEYVYDRPFLWGSKRTGPDLWRVGGKYNDTWHFNHMYNPVSTSEGSIMPKYPWLIKDKLDISSIESKMSTLASLGVPYTETDIANAKASIEAQARSIEKNLLENEDILKSFEAEKAANGSNFVELKDREIVAMIAYLQRLGTDIKANKDDSTVSSNP
jgi:cytochrome c oxidase cbb3-type subunit I/II